MCVSSATDHTFFLLMNMLRIILRSGELLFHPFLVEKSQVFVESVNKLLCLLKENVLIVKYDENTKTKFKFQIKFFSSAASALNFHSDIEWKTLAHGKFPAFVTNFLEYDLEHTCRGQWAKGQKFCLTCLPINSAGRSQFSTSYVVSTFIKPICSIV